MHRLRHRDRRHDLVRHRDDHLLQVRRRQLFYMDLNYSHLLMVHQYVVGNFLMLVDVVKMDVQQNLDALNLDEVLTFPHVKIQDVVNLVHHRLDVVVDVELHHQLKMDYYLDVVDVELRYQLNFQMKMDYFLDEVSQVLLLHPVQKMYLQMCLLVVAQYFLRGKL
jgi:hypothetical protein